VALFVTCEPIDLRSLAPENLGNRAGVCDGAGDSDCAIADEFAHRPIIPTSNFIL
jgi:hypothetical protein